MTITLRERMLLEAGFPELTFKTILNHDGGPGSGNFNHEGIKGQVGGSAPGKSKAEGVPSKDSTLSKEERKEYTDKVADMRNRMHEEHEFQDHVNYKVPNYDPTPFNESEARTKEILNEAISIANDMPEGTLFAKGCELYEKQSDGWALYNANGEKINRSNESIGRELCGSIEGPVYPPIEFIESTDDAKMVFNINLKDDETYKGWAENLNEMERKDLVKMAKKDPAFKELADTVVLYTEGGYVEQRKLAESIVADGLNGVTAQTIGEYANGNLYRFRDLYKGQGLSESGSSMANGMVSLIQTINNAEPCNEKLYRVTSDRSIIKTDTTEAWVPPKIGDKIRLDAPTSFTSNLEVEQELSKHKGGDRIHYVLEQGSQAVDVSSLSRYKQSEYLSCGEFEVVSIETKERNIPIINEPTKAEENRGIKENEWGNKYTFLYESTITIRQTGKTEFAKHEDGKEYYTNCKGHFDDRMVLALHQDKESGSGYEDVEIKGMEDTMDKLEMIRLRHIKRRYDGGPGSGNWGHEGIHGHLGGSAPGGGVHNRLEKEGGGGYTSFSQDRKAFAQLHSPSIDEFESAPIGTLVITEEGYAFEKTDDSYYMYTDLETGEIFGADEMAWRTEDELVRTVIPNNANLNYSKTTSPRQNAQIGKPEQYSDERKENAAKPTTGQEADDLYRKQSGALYSQLDINTKNAFAFYTGTGYSYINTSLRDEETYKEYTSKHQKDNIDNITKAINRSELPQDAYFQRGIGRGGFSEIMGVSRDLIQNGTEEELQSLIGKVGIDHGFGSCGSYSDGGFDYKPVVMSIYAPKGTKCMYVEPFSVNGDGDGTGWNGKDKQGWVSKECETIMQRGTQYRVTGIRKEDDRIKVDVEIIGQAPKDLTKI